jgi:hypothetical protein
LKGKVNFCVADHSTTLWTERILNISLMLAHLNNELVRESSKEKPFERLGLT